MALLMGRSLLRLRIKQARYTQRRLARKLRVSEAFITLVANGERDLSLERAANIAHLLGCGVLDLYEWREIPDEEAEE